MDYFKENASYRTTCMQCLEDIGDEYRKAAKEKWKLKLVRERE